jgi:hypothetical protein
MLPASQCRRRKRKEATAVTAMKAATFLLPNSPKGGGTRSSASTSAWARRSSCTGDGRTGTRCSTRRRCCRAGSFPWSRSCGATGKVPASIAAEKSWSRSWKRRPFRRGPKNFSTSSGGWNGSDRGGTFRWTTTWSAPSSRTWAATVPTSPAASGRRCSLLGREMVTTAALRTTIATTTTTTMMSTGRTTGKSRWG